MFHELLWTFTQLPDDYVVLDTETTGLPDENGLPDIVSLGVAVIRDRAMTVSDEFFIQPAKRISEQARAIHGISNEQAVGFASFESQWNQMAAYLNDQLIVIHNAAFDWPILCDRVKRYAVEMPTIRGVFCSQKAAIAWALAMKLPCSSRGPSLDTLTKVLEVENLRAIAKGIHGAKIDSQQTAQVVETLRRYGRLNNTGRE